MRKPSIKTKSAQGRRLKRVVERIIAKCADEVPTSWLDDLLTGPNKLVGEPPFSCQDIVKLCRGIKARILKLSNAPDQRPGQ